MLPYKSSTMLNLPNFRGPPQHSAKSKTRPIAGMEKDSAWQDDLDFPRYFFTPTHHDQCVSGGFADDIATFIGEQPGFVG